MKLVLELDDLEYDKLLFYYHNRPKVQQYDVVESVAKKIFMNGLDNNLVYARKRSLERSDLCVGK